MADSDVNCRIGSLEMMPKESEEPVEVNCRIGSLEIELHEVRK